MKDFPRLDDLLCGRPLLDLRDGVEFNRRKLERLHKEIELEHNRMDELSAVDAGVLLGALNFIDGLLIKLRERI